MLARKRVAVITRDKISSISASCTADQLSKAETLIIGCVQREAYKEEFDCLAAGKTIWRNSPLRKLDPYVDREGLMRKTQAFSTGCERTVSYHHSSLRPHWEASGETLP